MTDMAPLGVYVLYATDTDEKYIKIGQDGSLAIFDDEQSAKAVKLSHPKTDYKQVNYYSEKQVKKLYHQLEQAQSRVAELDAESVQAVANKVCGELPEGWVISLCMENGAAWVEAIKPSGYTIDIDRGDMSMVEQIDEALRVADERTGGIRR